MSPTRFTPFVIHPHPSPYQFLSIPSIPVNVVFSHCPICRSLELYWQNIHNCSWPASEHRFFAARPKYTASAINYTFCSNERNLTWQFSQCSNICKWIFVICRISKVSLRGSSKNKFHPSRIPAAPIPVPAVFLQHLSPFPQISYGIHGIPSIPTPMQTSNTNKLC